MFRFNRKSVQYRPRFDPISEALLARINELAMTRVRYRQRRIWVLLRREGEAPSLGQRQGYNRKCHRTYTLLWHGPGESHPRQGFLICYQKRVRDLEAELRTGLVPDPGLDFDAP